MNDVYQAYSSLDSVNTTVAVVVVVECCCCNPYWLVLMLVLAFAPSVLTFAPCALTFAPCACGVILLSSSTCHWLQLVLVAFFLQPLAQTVLAPVVVSPVATCTGGLPSTHWRTYSTCARATCTVWWWSTLVVVACIYIYLYRACGVPLHLPFDANHCFCIDGFRMQQNN